MSAATANDDEPIGGRTATDEEILVSWREEQFVRLGLNPMQAAALADAGVSWHEAERLFEKGATAETVVDLLL